MVGSYNRFFINGGQLQPFTIECGNCPLNVVNAMLTELIATLTDLELWVDPLYVGLDRF